MANAPSIERLRDLLIFNALTGELTWKRRGMRAWDTRYAGKGAFTAKTNAGYLHGMVDSIPLKAHRVGWAIYFGEWPSEIDHINGDKSDNRIENLREVTRQENSCNRSTRSDNRCGVAGVTHRRGKWLARIHVRGRSVCLGTFATIEEAASARRAADAKYGYHENHGRKS